MYDDMDVSDANRLKVPEDENTKLKVLADPTLETSALRELLSRKWQGPPPSTRAVAHLQVARAVGTAGLFLRRCQSQDDPLPILIRRDRTARPARDLTNERRRFGCERLFILLRREGDPSGITRIY